MAVNDLSTRMERNDSKTDMTEARVIALEKIANDAILLRRDLEETVGQFNSDIAVIKEILVRIDRDNTGRPYDSPN